MQIGDSVVFDIEPLAWEDAHHLWLHGVVGEVAATGVINYGGGYTQTIVIVDFGNFGEFACKDYELKVVDNETQYN